MTILSLFCWGVKYIKSVQLLNYGRKIDSKRFFLSTTQGFLLREAIYNMFWIRLVQYSCSQITKRLQVKIKHLTTEKFNLNLLNSPWPIVHLFLECLTFKLHLKLWNEFALFDILYRKFQSIRSVIWKRLNILAIPLSLMEVFPEYFQAASKNYWNHSPSKANIPPVKIFADEK